MAIVKTPLRSFILSLLAITILYFGTQPAQAVQEITGMLSDQKTGYTLVIPDKWNGTLLASLDAIAAGDVKNWLLDKGCALAATVRGPAGWNLTYAASNIIEAMDIFEDHFGKPKRTIIWGRSRGGITSRAALQLFPERFDGAIPMCGGGAGTVAMWNFKLDATFALDVLLGPQYGIKLQLNGFTDGKDTDTPKINDLVNKARQTPKGRARVALAAAFSQISTWNSPSQPEPAVNDYEAQADNQASQIAFALGTSFVPFLEGLAGGPFTWNHGIDYRVQLSRSGYDKLVKEMYKKAGLSLDADLKKLAKAPRVYANPDAVAFIEKHNMSWTGELTQPVFDITTTGDPAGPISDEKNFANIVRYAGNNNLLRRGIVHAPGHCNFTPGEQMAAFETMFRRLDTGKWKDDASAHGLNRLVQELQAGTDANLKGSNFVAVPLPNPMRSWDVRNWDTYNPTMK